MNKFDQLLSAINSANNIIITTHLFPDADGIGSQIALCLALKSLNKNSLCVNNENLLERYKYLDPFNTIVGLEEFKEQGWQQVDLIIVVDTNAIERAGKNLVDLSLQYSCPVFYIDHHPCSQTIKNEHCIDVSAAATGQVIGEFIQKLKIQFTKEMALPLYTAILIDTSSFRYPTVSYRTHALIAELMKTGIHPPEAYNRIYGTKKIEHMHLLGKVLSSTHINAQGNIAWIILHKKELENYQIDIEDTHAFINHLLILDSVKVACMFRDDGDHLKMSMRSTGEIDVGQLAIKLGGGGHSHSAATLFEKNAPINQLITETISHIENLISSSC